jgi:hypothetical protein
MRSYPVKTNESGTYDEYTVTLETNSQGVQTVTLRHEARDGSKRIVECVQNDEGEHFEPFAAVKWAKRSLILKG